MAIFAAIRAFGGLSYTSRGFIMNFKPAGVGVMKHTA
jgi:hypothetical protein